MSYTIRVVLAHGKHYVNISYYYYYYYYCYYHHHPFSHIIPLTFIPIQVVLPDYR